MSGIFANLMNLTGTYWTDLETAMTFAALEFPLASAKGVTILSKTSTPEGKKVFLLTFFAYFCNSRLTVVRIGNDN
ncbi:MAG TPA: hypothetical protein VFS46_01625, partial [Nitrososphaera sp.]|nr:hypothetical protein [Nitrososphaera sp.]